MSYERQSRGPIRTIVKRGTLTEVKPGVFARPEILDCGHTVYVTEKAYQDATVRNCPKCRDEGNRI